MNKRLQAKLPWIIAIVVIAGLLIYGFLPEPVPVDTVLVQRGSIQVAIEEDGETRIKERFVVSSPIAGKLIRIELHPGDRVQRGVTELARIEPNDPSLYDARYRAECQARVRAAQAAKQRASAALESAQESQELARHDYERAIKLRASNTMSQAEFDQAEHQSRITAAVVRTAGFALAVSEYELELAEIALRDLTLEPPTAGAGAMRLIAPIDGEVLKVLREDAGPVTLGSELLVVGNLEQLEMQIDVLSKDAPRIPPRARVVIEQWGGSQPLRGTVRLVEPMGFTKISALGVEEKRVNVIADFDSPLEQRRGLGDGFRIEARIIVDETPPESLRIPSGALFRQAQHWCVFRIERGRVQLRQVSVGENNGLQAQILNGLEEGDQVIVHPTTLVQPGVRVQARPL